MSFDPYAPCPCGSGKKLKFCCIDLVEPMEKVDRHREHHQPRMALQVLDRIEKQHPANPWVLIERASVHLDEGEGNEAKAALERLLEHDPRHKLGIVLRAIAVFDADGFDAAREHISEAFLRCSREYSEMLSGLALSLASLMVMVQKHMAARNYLTLAMRLAPAENQQEIFLSLLRFDSSRDCAYPLRSVHLLAEYSGAADLKSQAVEAGRLADLGCCEPAAEAFTRLGEEQPDCAVFWQNAGLCRAWAGDEESAADALHLAAQLHDDFDAAVELETMAQLLDLANTEDVVGYRQLEYRVSSASTLLSRLAGHPRIVSLPIPPEEAEEEGDQAPIGMFHVIDRERPDDEELSELTLDTVPNADLDVIVFDADSRDDTQAVAYVTGVEGERFDAARINFEEAAGDAVQKAQVEEGETTPVVRTLPAQVLPLQWRWYFPPRTPGLTADRLEQQKWREVIEDVWMNQPQEALLGKSPREAVDDPELKLPLTAAVYTLDALCDRLDYALDVNQLCGQLKVEPQSPIEVTSETPLNAFSAMQLNRLKPSQLSDAQLVLTLNRSLLIHHSRFLYDVLIEALDRPQCAAQINRQRACATLIELCRSRFRQQEAIEWAQRAGEMDGEGEGAFERQLTWKLREFVLRARDPEDAGLMPLLEQLYTRYAPKLPELQDQLDAICALRGIPNPWRGSALQAPLAAGVVWSPESAAAQEAGSASGGKKLWLPGQS